MFIFACSLLGLQHPKLYPYGLVMGLTRPSWVLPEQKGYHSGESRMLGYSELKSGVSTKSFFNFL